MSGDEKPLRRLQEKIQPAEHTGGNGHKSDGLKRKAGKNWKTGEDAEKC